MRNIQLFGRVVEDATKKLSNTSGREYLTFRIANNQHNEKDANGQEITYWFRVTAFSPRFVALMPYLTKGKPIYVSGAYSDRIYTTKTGASEIGRDILADCIEFMPGQPKPEGQPSAPIPVSAPMPSTMKNPAPRPAAPMPDITSEDIPF